MQFDEIGAPVEAYVCAVCGTVLDWVVGSGWAHPSWMDEDHLAVPVQEGQVETQGHCDFCFLPKPKYQIAVGSFQTEAPGFGSAGNWACCGDCARLIETNQWSRLTARGITSWEGRHGPMDPLMAQMLGRLYRQVRQHMRGGLQTIR